METDVWLLVWHFFPIAVTHNEAWRRGIGVWEQLHGSRRSTIGYKHTCQWRPSPWSVLQDAMNRHGMFTGFVTQTCLGGIWVLGLTPSFRQHILKPLDSHNTLAKSWATNNICLQSEQLAHKSRYEQKARLGVGWLCVLPWRMLDILTNPAFIESKSENRWRCPMASTIKVWIDYVFMDNLHLCSVFKSWKPILSSLTACSPGAWTQYRGFWVGQALCSRLCKDLGILCEDSE